MKHSLRLLIAFAIAALALAVQPARAERMHNDYFFKFVTSTDGLAASQVNAICKDQQGYVWFGTSNGLSRFDGYSIVNFYSDYTSNSALPDGYIETIQEDHEGLLWIGTASGYVVFDPVHEIFDRSVQQRLMKISGSDVPSLIYIDNRKNMWIAVDGKGLFFYKTSMDLVYEFAQTGLSPDIPQARITGICSSQEGVAVAFENGTVCCINSESRAVEWINNVLAKKNIARDNFHICLSNNRDIFLYSPNTSYIYDAQTLTWHTSLAELAEAWGCSWRMGDAVITDIKEDLNHFVWITTDRTGILLLDIENRLFRRHLLHTTDQRSLPTNNIQSLYIDDSNLLWVGTKRFGVAYWGFSIYRFLLERVADINGITEDVQGNLWLATNNRGLICRSTQDTTYTVFDRRHGLSDDNFSCVLAAKDGSIWAGSNRYGLNCMRGSSVTTLRHEAGKANTLAADDVLALAEDRNGNIWIATNGGGLQCYNTRRGTFANFNTGNNRMPSNVVTSLFIKGNNVVAGTSNGLAVINLSSNKVEIFQGTRSGNKQFSNPYITQVLIDSRDLIWIGTRDGLNLLDTKNDIVQIFGHAEGIPNNMICGLAEDGYKHIWVTTAGGVCRLVPQAAQTGDHEYSAYVYNYNESDGLQRSEFNPGAICSTRQGSVYMGGANGLNWINIGETEAKNTETKVMFTSLLFHDQRIPVGVSILNRVILTKDINSLITLTLPPNINSFAIAMSVSNYYRGDHPQFIYMLEGRDPQWHPGDPLMHGVRFSDLRPGHYVLHVKAVTDEGTMSQQEHTLEIIIERPWWMRWWAIAFYILAAIAVLVMFRWFIPWLHRLFVQGKKERDLFRQRTQALNGVVATLIAPIAKVTTQVNQLTPLLTTPEQHDIADNILHIEKQLLEELREVRDDDISALLPRELQMRPKANEQDAAAEDAEAEQTDEQTEATETEDTDEKDYTYALATRSRKALRIVYLVDGDQDIADYIADSLKNAFDFKIFNSAEQAWDAIGEQRPDLVLACEQLPDMSGSDLCIRLKQERSYARIPFVLMLETPMSVAEIEKNNITVAADDYVLHFYDLISLRTRCSKLMGESLDGLQKPMEDAMSTADAMTESVGELIKRHVKEYVVQNISAPKLPLDDLCRAINVPLPQLFRKLGELTGRTPTEYIRDIRLSEAANLLRSGNLKPIDVATEVGFPNLATFNRFFKEKYNISPLEFCEQQQ